MTFPSNIVSTRLLIVIVCLGGAVLPCRAQTTDGKINGAAPVELAAARTGPVSNATSEGQPHADNFVIGDDDVLAINVWKEAEISRTVTVRSDGKISLPLVGEVQASAKTPKQLEAEIAGKLVGYISEPEVTVIVQEIRSQRFNIIGQVAHPGSYVLNNSTTVLDAIAMGGGFRDFAKQKAIIILRDNPDKNQVRFTFNYKDVIKGHHLEQNIKLEPGDTIIVP
jgi:polysaccharide biosynthesis/export protein